MKANKIRPQSSRVRSTKYPGGGMLRNKYADGGAVGGYGMSRGQMSAALASRPAVKPSASSLRYRQEHPVPIGKAIGDAIRRNPKLMQMYGFQALLGAPQAAIASRAKTSSAPAKATTTTAPSRVKAFNPKNEDPKRMAERFTTIGGGPIDEITDIMLDAGAPINYRGYFHTRSNRDNVQTPMMSGSRPAAPAPAQRAAASPAAQRPATQRAAAPTAKGGSFSQAFAKARAAGEKTFPWNGKQYTTQLKGESTAKPQTRDTTPVQKMPPKVLTSVSKPYFESPTGKQVPAMAKTSFPTPKPGPVDNIGRGLAAAQSAIEQRKASTPTAQSTQYFKPGTMADYLEERRRKMQGNLMTKR